MPDVHFTNRGEINERFKSLNFNGVIVASADDESIQWRLTNVDGKSYFCEGEAAGRTVGEEDHVGCEAEAVWQFDIIERGAIHRADGWYCTACILEMLANDALRVTSGAIRVGSL